jgi:hypothetical protein
MRTGVWVDEVVMDEGGEEVGGPRVVFEVFAAAGQ